MKQLEKKSECTIDSKVEVFELPPDLTWEDYKQLSSEEKKQYLVKSEDDLVVDAGIQQIIRLMIAANTNSFTHCSVGSGTNAPAGGDIDLQTPIGRNLVNDRYIIGLVAHFDTFFGKNDDNGTWNETGIHTAASGGEMLCRRKFPAAFTKDNTKAAVVAWSITFAAVAD